MTTFELSQRLAALVQAIDGVTQVYDARPAAVAQAADLGATVTRQQRVGPIAMTTTSNGGLVIVVNIAVAEEFPAAETCRRVFEGVDRYLAANYPFERVDAVRVQVGRIT